MKYYILASRGDGEQLFLVESKPDEIGVDLSGYVYDKAQDKLFAAGAEVFMRGYWEEATGEIEIDDRNNPRAGQTTTETEDA